MRESTGGERFLQKTVVVNDVFKPWNDDRGVLFLSLKEFLLNEDSLDLR